MTQALGRHPAVIAREDWLELPSGSVVQVCRVEEKECVVRYVNDDGQMAPGWFDMTVEFLKLFGRRVVRGGRA